MKIPDGYVLMPIEATRAMTMAGCDSLPSCEHVFGFAGEMLHNAYRKMVEAGALRPNCEYCGPGVSTGLPGNACENCMNTGLKNPTAEDLK